MLSEQEIRQALHASRIVPLSVPSPHGPLGLEHLAGEVGRAIGLRAVSEGQARVRRPIELPIETWEKLTHLAKVATEAASRPMSASEVAGAIIEDTLAKVQ
jgi:hypothetical protein